MIVWAFGLIALAIFGHNTEVVAALDPSGASAPFHGAAAKFVLAPAARWDSVGYLQLRTPLLLAAIDWNVSALPGVDPDR